MPATKESAAKLSVFAVGTLIVLKVAASIVTGSIAIRADAIHSTIDLFGVIVGYIGIRISGKPPDERHPFGHGKAENIAGVVIAGLIFIAAGTIIYQAVSRLIAGAAVEMITIGIYVTAAALVINSIISWYALRVARATDSIALEATARDMFADMLSSGAVLVGLVLVRLTGATILDPIVALLVAVLIARTAYLTMKKSVGGLMDTRLPKAEEDEIVSCLREHSGQLAGFHKIRTRKAGSQRYIDFHLVVSKHISVERAHRLCDQLEQEIEARLSYTSVTIHVEPCDGKCQQCATSPDLCRHI
ncbi:MAG TPA: cation transporter [Dehalococcoidia bacterium]|nr:cation transporter [Dehalococcoidia bacterium]